MVGGSGSEVLNVGGEKNSEDVGIVGLKVGQGDELGLLAVLDELPDEDCAL